MTVFTKVGREIFAPVDASGNPRKIVNHDAQVWATEAERVLATGGFSSADAVGNFTDRTTYDAEAEGFTFISVDGDGASVDSAVAFIKESAVSGDWSVAIPIQGEKGWAPQFRIANDSARRVLELYDWTGGEGTEPTTTGYVGASGLTSTIGDAVDIRGPQGVAGAGTGDMLAADNLSDLTDVAQARENISVPTIAISLSALKALDTTKDTRAVYNGSIWVWTTGDLSAAVTADTVGAVYAKADAIATTAGAWVRQYETLKTEWFGAVGDGSTDDTAAFTAIATLVTHLGGATLRLQPGAEYLIDDWDLSLVSGLKIVGGHSASFTERTGTTSSASFIILGAGCGFDHLEYLLPTGLRRNRGILLSGTGSYITSGNVVSVDQQNNRANLGTSSLEYDAQTANFTVGATLTGGTSGATAEILADTDAGDTGTLQLGVVTGTFQDNETITDSSGGSATANGVIGQGSITGGGALSDGAVRLTGALCRLGVISVTNFDNPYFNSGTDFNIKELHAESYVLGCQYLNTTRGRTGSVYFHTQSPNSRMIAGMNGLLLTDLTGGSFDRIRVEDSGEHGVRFGGDIASNGVFINYMRVKNAGGCGFKVRSGSILTPNNNITVNAAIISDCGGVVFPGLFVDNEEGIFIERANNVTVNFARVFKESKTKSCSKNIKISSSTKITVNGCMLEDAEDQGIYLDNNDDGGVTSRNLTDITIRGTVVGSTSHAFYMNFGAASTGAVTLRNINIDITGRSIGGDGFHIASDGTGTVASACVFKGNFQTLTGAAAAGTGTTVANGLLSFEMFVDGVYTRFVPSSSTSGILHSFRSISGASYNQVAVVRADGDLENINNSYTVLSDRRIKANIEDAGSQWEDIKALRLRKFDNLLAGGQRHIGMIAQEAAETSPGLVRYLDMDETEERLRTAHPDATDEEMAAMLAEGPLGRFNASVALMKALGALQEAQARIEALETRLATVERTLH